MKRAAALVLMLATEQAFACSIYVPENEQHLHTTQAYFAQARDVAVVEVRAMHPFETEYGTTLQRITFGVMRRIKRTDLPGTFETRWGDIGCGPTYVVGGRYVVFATRDAHGGISFIEVRGPLEEGAGWSREYLAELNSLSTSPTRP